MNTDDQARLAEAVRFALAAHAGQRRKGTDIPYVSHLLQVAGLVLEHGGSLDQTVAGLLHDVLEDCPGVSEAQLAEEFGPEVARIVGACTDLLAGDGPHAKGPWLARKRLYLEKIAACDAAVRLVAACDKLDNLRSMVADLHAGGPETLSRFRGTPEQIVWYYRNVEGALGEDLPERLRRELALLTEELSGFVPGAEPA